MITSLLNRGQSGLNAFLFHPLNARGAAWFRIAFAVALPFFFWSRGLTGPHSFHEEITWIFNTVILSIEYWLAIVGLCVPLALGWRPRLCAFLLLLMLLPMAFLSRGNQSRQVILCALFAFSFIRSGAVRLPWRQESDSTLLINAGPSWPLRLIQLQLTFLYGANAIAKSTSSYLSGDILMAMSISLPNFKVDMSDGFLDLGPIAIPVIFAGIGSTLMEYFLAVGFWLGRGKWVVAGVGVGFHLSLLFIMQIFKLDLAAIFLYLAFLLPLLPRKNHSSKPILSRE